MTRCDTTAVDDDIRGFVQLLWDNGFGTISSCQGGEGHPMLHPSVTVVAEDGETLNQLLVRLSGFLEKHAVKWLNLGNHRNHEPYLYLRLREIPIINNHQQ